MMKQHLLQTISRELWSGREPDQTHDYPGPVLWWASHREDFSLTTKSDKPDLPSDRARLRCSNKHPQISVALEDRYLFLAQTTCIVVPLVVVRGGSAGLITVTPGDPDDRADTVPKENESTLESVALTLQCLPYKDTHHCCSHLIGQNSHMTLFTHENTRGAILPHVPLFLSLSDIEVAQMNGNDSNTTTNELYLLSTEY